MNQSHLTKFTGIPNPLEIQDAFPGLELTDGERAAIRGQRVMAGLVRVFQLGFILYGLDQWLFKSDFAGMVIGIILAYFIGLAKPKLPLRVSVKLQDYAARLNE